jgi:acylphosphatase
MAIAEQELEFHRRAIEQARRAGLSAYVLNEDGSVLRIWPDGRKEFIVVRHGLRSRSAPRDASRPTSNSAECGLS